MAILTSPRERKRFYKFAVVGVIGAVVDFGLANLLITVAHFPLWLAGGVSFICAILSNFTWNRYWTYPDSRSKPLFKQLGQFALISVAGLAIRLPILRFVEPVLEDALRALPFSLPFFSVSFYADNFTLALAVVIVMFWNFFVNRFVTYNDVS